MNLSFVIVIFLNVQVIDNCMATLRQAAENGNRLESWRKTAPTLVYPVQRTADHIMFSTHRHFLCKE